MHDQFTLTIAYITKYKHPTSLRHALRRGKCAKQTLPFFIMSELRLNLITREWVVIAPERAKRPDTFNTKDIKHPTEPYNEDCPFCPDNEAGSPGEIMRVPKKGPWQIRVVPNKFSCLSIDTKKQSTNKDGTLMVGGYGRHEVVIESPSHNLYIAHMSVDAINNLIQTYKSRFQAIYQDEDIEHVIIFKNHGEAAGTTLKHPHSQIIGTPITPMQFTDRLDAARSYFEDTGKCLMCALLSDELTEGSRIVLDTEHFTTFIPYAALSPFHTWIFPKRHGASFGGISSLEMQDLALHLKNILEKLYVGLDDPSFNFVIRSESPNLTGCEYFHWYISIVPRLSRPAGFEMGTGMYINSSTPEDSAAFLRDLKL